MAADALDSGVIEVFLVSLKMNFSNIHHSNVYRIPNTFSSLLDSSHTFYEVSMQSTSYHIEISCTTSAVLSSQNIVLTQKYRIDA